MFERAAESGDGLFSEVVENMKRTCSFPSGWSGVGRAQGPPAAPWDGIEQLGGYKVRLLCPSRHSKSQKVQK